MDGWVILDKPLGMGSTEAVGAIKRILRQNGRMGPRKGPGKTRVGHGGTLDPLASGVLPIAIGEATKLCGSVLDARKSYQFTIAFGHETTTLDLEGAVSEVSDHRPRRAEIEAILPRFIGVIEQTPPIFSALKVDGQRAYDLARKGEAPILKARQIEIFSLEIIDPPISSSEHASEPSSQLPSEPPTTEPLEQITLAANVAKGSYIRALARDIAHALGSFGHVTMLRRTDAGPFALDRAISLDNFEKAVRGAVTDDFILPVEAGLADIPALDLNPEQVGLIQQGQINIGITPQPGLYWARNADGTPIALLDMDAERLHIRRGFNL